MATLLGLACGQPRGSAEILLKEALRAADTDAELVRLHELEDPWAFWSSSSPATR